MSLFPEVVFKLLIIGALVLTTISVLTLIVMLRRDQKTKQIW